VERGRGGIQFAVRGGLDDGFGHGERCGILRKLGVVKNEWWREFRREDGLRREWVVGADRRPGREAHRVPAPVPAADAAAAAVARRVAARAQGRATVQRECQRVEREGPGRIERDGLDAYGRLPSAGAEPRACCRLLSLHRERGTSLRVADSVRNP
jgi:hypothetical protein